MTVRADRRLEDEAGPYAYPAGPPVRWIVALGFGALAIWVGILVALLALIR